MLEATRLLEYRPGIAAPVAPARARWRFALPDLGADTSVGRGIADHPHGEGALWMAPAHGEPWAFAPAADARAIAFLRARGDGVAGRVPRARRAAWLLRNRVPGARGAPRPRRARGRVVAWPADTAAAPAYLLDLAREAGVDLRTAGWAISAGGDAPHQKVLIWLFLGDDPNPSAVAKIARVPTMNARVRHGFRALTMLHAHGYADGERAPAPLFAGERAGLAIAVSSILPGVPFRRATTGRASCPAARAAIDALLDLARVSVRPADGTAGDALYDLLARYEHLFTPARDHARVLRRQIDVINDLGCPRVFQHGDPGAWNILIAPAGRAGLVDWEAADPAGPPLWDIFYLIRSIGIWAARLHGTRRSLDAFARTFLPATPFAALLGDATRQACEALAIDRALVEPLFHTCWMHRSLREAMARPAEQLARAHYPALSRLCVEQRDAPGLRAIFDRSPRSDEERSTT